MRILVDAHCFDQTAAEGINTYLGGVYAHLPQIMPEADFFFAADNEQRIANAFGHHRNAHFVKLKPSGWIKRTILDFPRLIRHVRADWTHFQYTAPEKPGCRVIITLHDILFKDFPEYFPLSYRISRDLLFRRAARRADLLATVSEYSRQRIARHYGIDPDKIVITPNAVRPDFFGVDRDEARRSVSALGIRDFILNVSRIEPRKNQTALVRAFHRLGLADKGYDLVLINHPSLRTCELEECIAALPPETARRVHRIDSKPFDELKVWYAAAQLFVFPSLAEGFGIPPLEAAATGTPVICHNDTAMADYTFFGDNLADLRTEGALEQLIAANLGNNCARGNPGAGITERIRERYNWRRSAETLAAAIRKA